MNIVIIGAASESFGRGQIADILQADELKGQNIRLTLVDIDEAALATMHRLAKRIKAHSGTDITLDATTDRAQALPGADFVITAVARKRYELWEQDFRVPLSHGFRHCLGENGGPGSLFHALRSLNLMLPICADIERLCPDALLLNFTNPESRVLHAILHLTNVKAAGICHGIGYAIDLVSKYLNMPAKELCIISAGINHFYTLLSVTEKATGQEWLPELIRIAATDTSPYTPPLFRKMAQVFDVFTFPSDDHIGEYLAYGTEYCGIKWHYGQESRAVSLHEADPPLSLADYANGRHPLDGRVLAPSGELTVPIIGDILLNRGEFREAVNVLNTEGYIPNLPAGAAIEVPATVDAGGIHPLHVDPIPETFAAMMRTQTAIQELTTEAYRTRSKKLLLQALLLDPNVNCIERASTMLDEMLEMQKEFLPVFSDDAVMISA